MESYRKEHQTQGMIEVKEDDFLLATDSPQKKSARSLIESRYDQLEEDTNVFMRVFSLMYTISNYIISDISKKQRSFKIGVSTIFIAVSFITMMKSVTDVMPVAFLKLSQDQAGGFDIRITSSAESMLLNGDINHHHVGPFGSMKYDTEKAPSLLESITAQSYHDETDHTQIMGMNLLKFDAFEQKLDSLNQTRFRGFSPRWQLPMKLRNTTNPARNTSSIVIIIDSVKEAELKFGQDFTDERIGDSEVMVSHATMKYLNISEKNKDKIELFLDLVGIIKTLTGH